MGKNVAGSERMKAAVGRAVRTKMIATLFYYISFARNHTQAHRRTVSCSRFCDSRCATEVFTLFIFGATFFPAATMVLTKKEATHNAGENSTESGA